MKHESPRREWGNYVFWSISDWGEENKDVRSGTEPRLSNVWRCSEEAVRQEGGGTPDHATWHTADRCEG